MAVFQKNIVINKGCDFSQSFELNDENNNPLNLYGYTVFATLRKNYTSNRYINFTVYTDGDSDGTVYISLNNIQTKKLSSGRYVYDVIKVSPEGIKTRVAEGLATISEGVTL